MCECLFFRDFAAFRPNSPTQARVASFSRFLNHTQWQTTVGMTPLNERSDRRRDLYLAAENNHDRHPCLRRDSKPQSQQAVGCRVSPWTARPLGSAFLKGYRYVLLFHGLNVERRDRECLDTAKTTTHISVQMLSRPRFEAETPEYEAVAPRRSAT